MVSAGALFCLGVIGTSVFFLWGHLFHEIRPGLFDSVHRAAKTIEGNTRVGFDRQSFRQLLQKLSTEIEVVRDEVKTNKEKEVLSIYSNVLSIYEDSMTIWDKIDRRLEIRDSLHEAYINTIKPRTIPFFGEKTAEQRELDQILEKNEHVWLQWRTVLNEGSIPAFEEERSGPESDVRAFDKMRNEGTLKPIVDKYKLKTHIVNGYAFLSSDTMQGLWELAKKRASEAKALIDKD